VRTVLGLGVVSVVLCLLAGCSGGGTTPTSAPSTRSTLAPATASTTASATALGSSANAQGGAVPRPDHVVVVLEENHSFADIVGNPAAPYLNSLAAKGALFTASFAVAHPSEPNYLALFSGSTQGLTDDSCPRTFAGNSLGAELASAGLGFAGYAESLPNTGFTGCSAGEYARKHAPWVNFPAIPASASLPFTAFPTNYASLPTLSFVIPNLSNDMHDGTIAQGDSWLRANLDGYARWAAGHNSLLLVTWDEDDYSQANQVPTILVGARVKPGRYPERIDHYSVLRTLEAAYSLPPLGLAASATPITDCWSTGS
jgi:phosphatidylinositol-3-phosphatase